MYVANVRSHFATLVASSPFQAPHHLVLESQKPRHTCHQSSHLVHALKHLTSIEDRLRHG
jgi:hypothetical protein